MSRKIPPMNAVRVFEEAARHSSYREAAESLFITQGAVSKQILNLETFLGLKLFERLKDGVVLTDAGKEYYSSIRSGFDSLEAATHHLMTSEEKNTILVNLMPSMAVSWVFERMQELSRINPNLVLRLRSGDEGDTHKLDQFDVAVLCVKQNNYKNRELVTEEDLILIASPAARIRNLSELATHDTIGLCSRPRQWEHIDIDENLGITLKNPKIVFQHYHMIINAVLNNVGIGFAPRFLCRSLLRNHKLCNPFDIGFNSEYGIYIETNSHSSNYRCVDLFSDWIKREINTTAHPRNNNF